MIPHKFCNRLIQKLSVHYTVHSESCVPANTAVSLPNCTVHSILSFIIQTISI